MKYDKDTMNSLQEAYASVNEEKYYKGDDRNPNTGFPKGIRSEKNKKVKQKRAKRPNYEGSTAGSDLKDITDSYKRRIDEAIKVSRKEYTSEEKKVVPEGVEKNCGCGETPCKTYGNVNEKKKEMEDKMKEVDDMRSLPTRMNLIKTKLRAMGLNMSHELKGKELSEVIDYTLAERNRYEKETGIDTKTGKKIVKGGTAKNDKAFQIVMKKYNPQRMGANEPKKNRRAKPDERPGKYTIMLQKKKDQQAKNDALDAEARKAGYKNTQDFVNVQAVRKGGLGGT